MKQLMQQIWLCGCGSCYARWGWVQYWSTNEARWSLRCTNRGLCACAATYKLGTEFDSTKKDAAEIRTLVTGFDEQNRTMIDDIEMHFSDFAVKSGEMRDLIVQSEGVLQQSIGQMNTIMDGSIRAMNCGSNSTTLPSARSTPSTPATTTL